MPVDTNPWSQLARLADALDAEFLRGDAWIRSVDLTDVPNELHGLLSASEDERMQAWDALPNHEAEALPFLSRLLELRGHPEREQVAFAIAVSGGAGDSGVRSMLAPFLRCGVEPIRFEIEAALGVEHAEAPPPARAKPIPTGYLGAVGLALGTLIVALLYYLQSR